MHDALFIFFKLCLLRLDSKSDFFFTVYFRSVMLWWLPCINNFKNVNSPPIKQHAFFQLPSYLYSLLIQTFTVAYIHFSVFTSQPKSQATTSNRLLFPMSTLTCLLLDPMEYVFYLMSSQYVKLLTIPSFVNACYPCPFQSPFFFPGNLSIWDYSWV